jgi:hypothetical protein
MKRIIVFTLIIGAVSLLIAERAKQGSKIWRNEFL